MEGILEALTGNLGVIFGAVAMLAALFRIASSLGSIDHQMASITHHLESIDNQLKGIKEPAAASAGALVLLADDSALIQKVVELTFNDTSFRLICASDGKSAMDLLEKEKFDMIIADVHLRGRNGYEICEHAKRLYPEIPVLLLAGAFEELNEEPYRSCGADEVLKKPFNSAELIRVTGSLLDGAKEIAVLDEGGPS